MRTIEFRGKRVDGKGWAYGDLIQYGEYKSIRQNEAGENEFPIFIEYVVHPETVGMFTGLHDKNGVKIFEHDVLFNSNKTILTLQEDPRTYLVKWVDGEYSNDGKWLHQKPSFVFEKINPNGKRYMELIFSNEQIEVIGNIHEGGEK